MADYYDMKDKMRRAGQDEQAARFRAATGNDPYAAEIIAAESRVPAPPRAAAPRAPQANVRGVPDEMTAEYYAPPAPSSAPAAPAAPVGPSPAKAAAQRFLAVRAERERDNDAMSKAGVAGGALGAAVGAGLGGAPGALLGGLLGLPLGTAGGNVAINRFTNYFEDQDNRMREAQRAIYRGIRDGTFTKEEVKAALGGEDVDAVLQYR
jgi:hypothetical protein